MVRDQLCTFTDCFVGLPRLFLKFKEFSKRKEERQKHFEILPCLFKPLLPIP